MTHYLIYKITNNVNGKIYIGKHKTENLDDGYMGSGLAIKRAIGKYGVENFTKEILFDVDDEELMDFVEEVIVDEAFVAREDTYNIALGGQGGHLVDCSEETRQKLSKAHKGKTIPEEMRQRISGKLKGRPSPKKGTPMSEEQKQKISRAMKGCVPWNKGVPRSEETKHAISCANKGKVAWNKGKKMSLEFTVRNREAQRKCQLGMHWFNNGVIQTRAKECPDGFKKGRLR